MTLLITDFLFLFHLCRLQAVENVGTMLDTDLVWARDPHEGYIQGKISELGAHEYEIIPVDKSIKKRNCPIEDVFPSCDAKSDNDDNCKSN